MSKKRKINATVSRARPIDKVLAYVRLSGQDETQSSVKLVQTSFPCTITGLRWEMAITQLGGSGICEADMAIVIIHEGQATPALSTATSTQFYEPEQNCLAFKTLLIDNHSTTKEWSGSTKTMRKMKIGDAIHFVALGQATNTCTIAGCIQLFCMS